MNLALPPSVLASFIEIMEKKSYLEYKKVNSFLFLNEDRATEIKELKDVYNRLSFFWLKLANSPLDSIDNILLFCRENDVRLSKRGNLIAYRRIQTHRQLKPTVTKNKVEDTETLQLVKGAYEQIKYKSKKSPKNYSVFRIDSGIKVVPTYSIAFTNYDKSAFLGNLAEIQDGTTKIIKEVEVATLEQETVYTSAHNSGKHTFKIGDVYKINEDEVNVDLSNCAAGGLHAACVNYNYSGFGDIPVVVLINPSKAIYTPLNETGKFRTSQMKLACINPNPHGVHIDEALIEQADAEYNEFSVDELLQIVKDKDFSSVEVSGKTPSIKIIDVEAIIKNLSSKVIRF